MTFVEQIVGVNVVGAKLEQPGVQPLLGDAPGQFRHMRSVEPSGRPQREDRPHSGAGIFHNLVDRARNVRVFGAGGDERRQRPPAQTGRLAGDRYAQFIGQFEFIELFPVLPQDQIRIDVPGEAQGLRPVEHGAGVGDAQLAVGGLHPCRHRGNSSGHPQPDPERHRARFVEEGFHPGKPQHVADFVRIRCNHRGAARNHGAGVFSHGDHGTFEMDVRVDEARRREPALGFDDMDVRAVGAAGFENGRNPAAFDQDIRRMQFAAEHVDQHRRSDDQIRRFTAQRDIDQVPPLHLAVPGKCGQSFKTILYPIGSLSTGVLHDCHGSMVCPIALTKALACEHRGLVCMASLREGGMQGSIAILRRRGADRRSAREVADWPSRPRSRVERPILRFCRYRQPDMNCENPGS